MLGVDKNWLAKWERERERERRRERERDGDSLHKEREWVRDGWKRDGLSVDFWTNLQNKSVWIKDKNFELWKRSNLGNNFFFEKWRKFVLPRWDDVSKVKCDICKSYKNDGGK